MRKHQKIFILLLLSCIISSCAPSLNKEIVNDGKFYYGRIKIYQIYDERKMRLISKECHFFNEYEITNSSLSTSSKAYNWIYNPRYVGKGLAFVPDEKIDYILEGGLLVLKKLPKNELVFDKIRCQQQKYLETKDKEIQIIRFPSLIMEQDDKNGVIYFGDINIFISKNPSDSKQLEVKVTQGAAASKYKIITNYYDPLKITISNNQEQTFNYLKEVFGTNLSNNQIYYHPFKTIDTKTNVRKNIPASDKILPF